MKRVHYWLYIIWLSLKWMFRYNLGDLVIYKGKKCVLIQGVCSPRWDLVECSSNNKIADVHQREFVKVKTIKNLMGSFRSGYSFYVLYWFEIWVRNGIEPWMRQCRIWGAK